MLLASNLETVTIFDRVTVFGGGQQHLEASSKSALPATHYVQEHPGQQVSAI
jgi:hypothetical protein